MQCLHSLQRSNEQVIRATPPTFLAFVLHITSAIARHNRGLLFSPVLTLTLYLATAAVYVRPCADSVDLHNVLAPSTNFLPGQFDMGICSPFVLALGPFNDSQTSDHRSHILRMPVDLLLKVAPPPVSSRPWAPSSFPMSDFSFLSSLQGLLRLEDFFDRASVRPPLPLHGIALDGFVRLLSRRALRVG